MTLIRMTSIFISKTSVRRRQRQVLRNLNPSAIFWPYSKYGKKYL